jgi:hypothetical protein
LYGNSPEPLGESGGSGNQLLLDAAEEILRLRKWVGDLQDGMYVNCIYCGHRYPPGTPEARDKNLYQHICTCPKHPLSKALKEIDKLKADLENARSK